MTVTSTVPVPGEASGLAGETAVMDVLLFTVTDVARRGAEVDRGVAAVELSLSR